MILFGTPNRQTIDLMNLITDCLLILTTGVTFWPLGEFVDDDIEILVPTNGLGK
jgi:hypothetical protein